MFFFYKHLILLFEEVQAFCLKLKNSITTELIGFSILGKIGPLMGPSYVIFRHKSCDGFKLFFQPVSALLIQSLNVRLN